MAKVYFSNIEEVIINEIEKSKWSINVAVAWFTNQNIYNILLDKAKKGLDINLILNQDRINCNPNALDFNELINNGIKIHWNKNWRKNLLHEKFCIIDESLVIEGTYNWTLKAEQLNIEHIIILKTEVELIKKFIERFKDLADMIPGISIDMPKDWVIKNNRIKSNHLQHLLREQKKAEEKLKKRSIKNEWLPEYTRPWTEDDEALLLHYYYEEKLPIKYLVNILKRTNSDLKRHLEELDPIAIAMNLK